MDGTPAGRVAVGPAVHTAAGPDIGNYRFLTIGLSYKVAVTLRSELLQSGRAFSYKVAVDNLLNQQVYPQEKNPQEF